MKKEYDEKAKQQVYDWRKRNREKYNEMSRRSYEKNKEKIAQKAKERYEQQKIKKVFKSKFIDVFPGHGEDTNIQYIIKYIK